MEVREIIMKRSEEEDRRVIAQDTLTPERHINGIFAPTYKTLTNISVAFSYMNKSMMKKIITTMIRRRLEYAAVVWSPYRQKDIRPLQRWCQK
ncbi:hypothetical protein E2C01_065363 [Portunus trituberculatus]|uniref:Uncharacterized protein n=1 Tax=Portunus trituberculatus TaxID=210409 RepID=A0A5B7HRH6_PORTR|nr:hypothetical protein [Portunus trituberculatus]